ncbi:hypothetical protein ACQPYE_26650 [Actinosynnema sp. CA-299493]
MPKSATRFDLRLCCCGFVLVDQAAEDWSAVKLVLLPLIHGRSWLLTGPDCRLITRWFLKTMLMLELSGDRTQREALPEHEDWVRSGHLPPDVALWVGSARQLSGTATAGRALDVRVGGRGGLGWIFTIIVGRLIMVAVAGQPGTGYVGLTGPLAGALTRVWPDPPLTVPLPPRVKLGRRQVPLILELVQQSVPTERSRCRR